MADDVANVPNVLTRTPGEFQALEEIATELLNPGYIPAVFSTLGQRHHGPLFGKFIQAFMTEVQEIIYEGWTSIPTVETETTVDATPKEIATIAIADGECISIEAEVWGKKAAGDWVHQRIRAQYERDDAGDGVQVLDVEYDTGPRYSDDATLTTAHATLVIDGNAVDIRGVGEATSIGWTASYSVRRVT